MSDPQVVLHPRNEEIGYLINECIEGRLKFSGPDSLYSKIHAMGYNCNSLYEMVLAAKAEKATR